MLCGLLTAISVSAVWILIQIGWMHIRPAENRIRAMTIGYLISLFFVYAVYRFVPFDSWFTASAGGEAWGIGLFHAYFFHLLIFLLYAECFYHVERAVTLRILIELMEYPEEYVPVSVITKQYNVGDMIGTRLEVLQSHHFVQKTDDGYMLQPKGMLFAKIMQVTVWIFQSKPQSERV
jgi:hypothetical protein